MPHRFKRARRASRPQLPSSNAHPLAACSSQSDLTTSSDDMDHFATPPRRRGVCNPRPMKESDVRQTSHKTRMAWKGEVAGRIIPITNPVEQFLDHFVPGEKPTNTTASIAFRMPRNAKKESDLYQPLCDGFTRLVGRFKKSNKLVFKNHAHGQIKFPYKLYESEHHATRPDVIASFPGKNSFDEKHPDGWRNISFVVEAKLKESEDPMRSYSDAHELTLVQLAKSARNLLVSQSRLFVFVIGVYGKLARIFRFDHAGAVCSRAFNYTTLPGSRLFYEFLWRFTHPIAANCDFVGADPTVRWVPSNDHEKVAEKLRDAGVVIHDATESAKAYRYITVGDTNPGKKTYLAYDLLFLNPHLISRATTVWEAIEVDECDNPRGNPAVIKDAWRQLVRQKETEHYEDIFTSAFDVVSQILGVAQFLCGADLGAEEQAAMARGESGGKGIGHVTVTSRHTGKVVRPYNERSHSRLVLGSVGVPLSRFNSTRELVEAFRDAVKGHREAFQKGVLHRDVSEGNIMISRDHNVPWKGFIQDFDYSFNWKNLLAKLGMANEWEDWDKFVRDELAKLAEKRKEEMRAQWQKEKEAARQAQQAADGPDSDGVNPEMSPEKESEGQTTQLPGGVAQSLDTEDDPSPAKLDAVEERVGVQVPVIGAQNDSPPSEEEIKNQCKQRTGTLYFKAIDLLDPGDVVHEVRHDLESFFWLLIWILLRHTFHLLGRGACEELFDCDSERACQNAKTGFLTGTQPLEYLDNEPLNQLVAEFSAACKGNYRTQTAEPTDPLTHEKVLDIFDRALAREAEWPTSGDHAIPYAIPDLDEKPDRRESRAESNIARSRIDSGTPVSLEAHDDLPSSARGSGQALFSGSRRSLRLAHAAQVPSGSRSRKRSREAHETTNVAKDSDSDDERTKRTRTVSEHQSGDGKGGKGGRKQAKVRRGRK